MPAPPKSLTDFAAIAQKSGLKSGKTGPKSLLELRDLPVGKSSAIDANRTLLSMLFQGHDLEMYQPVKTVDIDGNRFIVMKIGDTPGKVPTLAEVKDEVVKAWKKQQAAELAKKHAEEFAKKAEEAKTPLASFFADNKSIKVVRTDPFSELTGGDVSMVGGQIQQQPYRFSQPSEIVAAGPDFLAGRVQLERRAGGRPPEQRPLDRLRRPRRRTSARPRRAAKRLHGRSLFVARRKHHEPDAPPRGRKQPGATTSRSARTSNGTATQTRRKTSSATKANSERRGSSPLVPPDRRDKPGGSQSLVIACRPRPNPPAHPLS